MTVERLNKKIERQLFVNGGATGLVKVITSLDFCDLEPRTIIIGIGIHIIIFFFFNFHFSVQKSVYIKIKTIYHTTVYRHHGQTHNTSILKQLQPL